MRFTCALLLNLCCLAGFSQSRVAPEYKEVNGVLLDSISQQPISSAHIWTKHFNTTSNADGSFFLLVQTNDSIHTSHVSYNTLIIAAHSVNSKTPTRILMTQRVVVLKEVSVSRVMSEDDFRKKIAETKLIESEEEQNAKANLAALNYYIKSIPQMSMNANENYREYMKGPQGVTIFSSNGQKGLIKAIRDVIKTKAVPFKNFVRQKHHVINFNSIHLKDSSSRHQADSLKHDK